ncbi:MAG: hypothetical protein GY856_25100, partial [bacterium]|nr:hypothetical protein [bacterium]
MRIPRIGLVAIVLASLAAGTLAAGPLTVGGTVKAADGRPVADVEVTLLPLVANYEQNLELLAGRLAPDPAATVRTDGMGRFVLEAPGVGMYQVRVRSPGWVPVQYAPLALVQAAELAPVALPADAGAGVEVRRERVESGIGGAWVAASSSRSSPVPAMPGGDRTNGWHPAPRLGRTDADGVLTLPRAPGEWLDLVVTPPWTALPRRVLEVEGLRLLIEPRQLPERRVEIRGIRGQPSAGVVVAIGALGWPMAATGADGAVGLRGRFPKPMRLHLLTAWGRRHAVDLEAGRQPAIFVVPEPTAIAGRVVDAATGKPLAGSLVWSGDDPGARVFAASDGGYSLTTPSDRRFWVQAEAAGYLPRSGRVAAAAGGPRTGPVLALERAVALSGRVVDEGERPLAGVEVAAIFASPAGRPPAFRPDEADARAVTDAEGRFRLALLRAGASYALTADLLGYEPASVEVAMPPAAAEPHPRVRIVLGSGTRAYGRVIDLDEQPVAGAEVRLRAAEDRLKRRIRTIALEDDPFAARSDAAGRFELSALPGPEVDITVRGEGFAPLVVRGVAVPADPRPADLGTLVLEPGASVTGWVTDSEGVGIAGVEVWATHKELRRSITSMFSELRNVEPDTETGEDGRFAVTDLAPGDSLHLLFRGRGYLPAARRAVKVPPPAPIDVVLIAGATAGGRVVDEDEQPVAGAVVSVWPRAGRPGEIDISSLGSEHEQSTQSDDEGIFFLETLGPGSYEIEAFALGFQVSERQTLEATAGGEIADLLFVLKRGATLEGRILITDGEPVEGARVMVDRPSGMTDAEGFYRVEGIPPGMQTVDVRHPELNRVVRELEIEPGENTLDLTMESGYPVSGLVRSEDGTLLDEVDVELQGGKHYRTYSVVTDETGSFRFPRVACGSYLIRALKKGFATTEIPDAVRVSDAAVEHLEVPLRAGAVIAGRIRGLTFEELAKVRVLARFAGGGSRRGYVDYEGNYEIRDLGSGDWQLRASLEGGRRETSAWVTIELGNRRIHRDLEFRTGFALSGRVLHNGTPVADALVSVVGRDVATRRQVAADYQGGFRIEDLLPGGYRLEVASARELITESRDLRLEGDLDLVIEITTAEVSGRVLAAGGEALADALVVLQRLLPRAGAKAASTPSGPTPTGV